jgi:hypothetical protein
MKTRAVFVLGLFAASDAFAAEKPLPLEPVMIDDELYTESFTAIADLADGTYVKAQLGISNAGSGDGNGACRIYIGQRDKPSVSKGKVVDRQAWRFERTPLPRLVIGQCKATAGRTLSIEATIDDAQLLLELEAAPEEMRAPVHAVRNGEDFYDLEVLIPWAAAKASYIVNGEPARSSSGFGYADHSRANALPGKTAKSWVRFRALGKERSRLVLVRFPPAGKPFAGWVWDQSQKSPAELSRVQLQPRKGDEKAKAWRVMLDGDGGPWRITSGKLIQRDAPIEERGALGSILGAVVGNPVTYTYRAVLEGRQDRGQVSGILEVTLADE